MDEKYQFPDGIFIIWGTGLAKSLHNNCKLSYCMTTLSSDWYLFRRKIVIWPSIQSLMKQVAISPDCSNKALISLVTVAELIFRLSGFAFHHLQFSSLTLAAWKIVCYFQAWLLWWIMRTINETHLLLPSGPRYSNDPQRILHLNSFANFWAFQLVNHFDKHPR